MIFASKIYAANILSAPIASKRSAAQGRIAGIKKNTESSTRSNRFDLRLFLTKSQVSNPFLQNMSATGKANVKK